jgi:nitrile hydratase
MGHPEFKRRLLADARSAALELGLDPGPSPVVVALENTDIVHHMIVCTLCSCYPRALLGPPPAWHKSLPYRSRAVSAPRGVLAEFGLEIGDDVELRGVDSTADIRYLVIPLRPPRTDELIEEKLAALGAWLLAHERRSLLRPLRQWPYLAWTSCW